MNIGTKIYELRNSKNMSQGDLADYLDVSRQSVSKWENNTAIPDLDKLVKLCDLFEITLDELTGRGSFTQEQATAPAPQVIVYKNPALTQQKIIGYILLVISIIGGLILFYIAPDAVLLLVPPILACSIICLSAKKRALYWCIWTLCWPVPLLPFVLTSSHTLLLLPLIYAVLMFIYTWYSFRKTSVVVTKPLQVLLILGWIVYFILLAAYTYLIVTLLGYTVFNLFSTALLLTICEIPIFIGSACWYWGRCNQTSS